MFGAGYVEVMHASDRSALLRLAALTRLTLETAEEVNGDIADEAVLAELRELDDRVTVALRELVDHS